MSRRGGGSCAASASLARYIPRARRGRKKQQQHGQAYLMGGRRRAPDGYAASVELSASSSTWPADSVVRVVLWSSIVEVYAGVVLACAVVGNHPPGLCLAHGRLPQPARRHRTAARAAVSRPEGAAAARDHRAEAPARHTRGLRQGKPRPRRRPRRGGRQGVVH
ncbi:hypothetical protein ZWY2020_019236 [Hordeum vulgare]|nr:hypothetical protein ZWY2020_019236 [Hordeum vulgare]